MVLGLAAAASGLIAQPPREITSAAAIRLLSADEAGQGRQVRLRGVVTARSGWQSSFFVQDASAGISVNQADGASIPQAGQLVEIRGVTQPGQFAPSVTATSVTVVGSGAAPAARLFRYDQLNGGEQDSQWVAVRGIVRSAMVKQSWGHAVLLLELGMGGGSVASVRVHDFPVEGWAGMPGSVVRLRGVCATVFNDKRQFVGLRFFVRNLGDISIEQPAPADPFAAVPRPIGNMLQFGDQLDIIRPIKVRGVVTYSQRGQGFYIQEGAQGIFVQSAQTPPAPLGAGLEVVGYPATGRYSPTLEDAQYRIVAPARPLAAVGETAAGMIVHFGRKDGFPYAPYDSVLVRLRALLVEEIPGPEGDVLMLRDGPVVFVARLAGQSLSDSKPAAGSLIDITGICVVGTDSGHEAESFEMLLRSAADIVVVKPAPWWTVAHATFMVVLLAFALLLMAAWQIIARRQASLRLLTLVDSLTGLYNRRGFLLLAEQQRRLALRKRVPMLCFYIDLNEFKEINDTLGHKTGDLALQAAAAVLRECFRETDVVGRLGGDEFAITAVAEAPGCREQLEQRLAATVRRSNLQPGRTFRLSLSVGVLCCDESLRDASFEELLARADALMYQQKADHHTKQNEASTAEPVSTGPLQDTTESVAMASISTRASLGKRATSTVDRAGATTPSGAK